METFVTVVHVFLALFMILVVLVQGGNQGGVGAALGGGGGNSGGVMGATGATTFLSKLTYGAAALFMVTSVMLTMMQGSGGETGLKDQLRQQVESGAAASQPGAPAATEAEGEAAPQEAAPAEGAAPANNAAPAEGSATPTESTP